MIFVLMSTRQTDLTTIFLDYKMYSPPPQISEENGGASYSANVAYLAR